MILFRLVTHIFRDLTYLFQLGGKTIPIMLLLPDFHTFPRPWMNNAFQGELVQKLRYLLFPIFLIALYDYIHTSSFQEE